MLSVAGIELLPAWPTFAAFALAGLLLNLVPGQDMLFVMMSSGRGGRRAGVVAAVGIGAGALVHIVLAAIGITALLAASKSLFLTLRLVGAAYLLTLALSMLKPRHASPSAEVSPPDTLWSVFRKGAFINITNPKVALFFWSFLPAFVSGNAEAPAIEALALGLWFDTVGTVVNVGVALASDAVARRIRERSTLTAGLRIAGGMLLGALAIRLAASSI